MVILIKETIISMYMFSLKLLRDKQCVTLSTICNMITLLNPAKIITSFLLVSQKYSLFVFPTMKIFVGDYNMRSAICGGTR